MTTNNSKKNDLEMGKKRTKNMIQLFDFFFSTLAEYFTTNTILLIFNFTS